MGTRGKSWRSVEDSPEQIALCLQCERDDCVDCIGRHIPYTPKARYRGEAKIVEDVRINKTAENVIRMYSVAKCDREIAETLGIATNTVLKIRQKLNLPAIRDTTWAERKRMVEFLIQRGA